MHFYLQIHFYIYSEIFPLNAPKFWFKFCCMQISTLCEKNVLMISGLISRLRLSTTTCNYQRKPIQNNFPSFHCFWFCLAFNVVLEEFLYILKIEYNVFQQQKSHHSKSVAQILFKHLGKGSLAGSTLIISL